LTSELSDDIFELPIDKEIDFEKKIVWVFGHRRSGTSWVANLLHYHKATMISEPLIGYHLAGLRPPKKDSSPFFVRRIEEQSDRPDYFFSKKYKNTWKPFLRKLILNRIYAQVREISPVIIKEPNGSTAADLISQCLPNSKFVWVLRDGRDSIHSDIEMKSKGGFNVKEQGRTPLPIKNRIHAIELRAKIWVEIIKILKKAYENHNKDSRILVRYENIRQNTFEELKKIYEMLQIKLSDDELKNIVDKNSFENLPSNKKGIGTPFQFGSGGNWKKNFTSEEQDLLNSIMGKTLEELNYEVN